MGSLKKGTIKTAKNTIAKQVGGNYGNTIAGVQFKLCKGRRFYKANKRERKFGPSGPDEASSGTSGRNDAARRDQSRHTESALRSTARCGPMRRGAAG